MTADPEFPQRLLRYLKENKDRAFTPQELADTLEAGLDDMEEALEILHTAAYTLKRAMDDREYVAYARAGESDLVREGGLRVIDSEAGELITDFENADELREDIEFLTEKVEEFVGKHAPIEHIVIARFPELIGSGVAGHAGLPHTILIERCALKEEIETGLRKLRKEVNRAKENSDYADEEIDAALVKTEAVYEHYWVVRIYVHELGHHLGYQHPSVEEDLVKRFVRDVDLVEVFSGCLSGLI